MTKSGTVAYALSWGVLCFALWLLLSGHYTGLLLAFGGLSCVLAVLLALRMGLAAEESMQFYMLWRLPAYWLWLLVEIAKANWQVTRCILAPRRYPISPVMFTVRVGQRSELARVLYANSITLTPGTVAVRLHGEQLHVHALTREAADDILSGTMDRRVCRLERPA